MYTVLALLTLLLLVVTALPLLRHPAWWIRGWDFPRLQLFVVAGLLAGAQWLLLDLSRWETWALIVTALACALYQAWWIFPYTRLHRPEVVQAESNQSIATLSILTANVLMTNHNAQTLIDMVRRYRPDILVTLESDKWWEAQLDTLSDDYPHSIRCPLDNLYGMHVFSRLPLHDAETRFLVDPEAPSMHAAAELANGARVRVHFLHPEPPSPSENASSRERDAELVVVARSVADSRDPIIVTGDLNDVAWSRTTRLFRKISGLLDPRVGRGMFNTFHADYPFARWPLDHLFHSRHFRLRRLLRLPHIGSDHFPLFTELSFHRDSANPASTLDADAEDQQTASQMADAEQVGKHDVPAPRGAD